MNDLIKITGKQEVEKFDPKRYRLKQAALEYTAKEAKRIRDWPALEAAIDGKIDEQRKFLIWWKANVKFGGGSKNRDSGSYPVEKAEDLTGMKQQRVSDLSKRLKKTDQYREFLLGVEYRAAMLEADGAGRHGHLLGKYEWYTPAQIIEAAREVMDGIDLDPASCSLANKIVKAKKFYSERDNGLNKDWHGKVFLNPPFAHPIVEHFADKLLQSYVSGTVKQAVWLSNACVDVKWWHALAGSGMICFHLGRIKFYGADDELQPPTLGQSIIYLGNCRSQFFRIFKPFGTVVSSHEFSRQGNDKGG